MTTVLTVRGPADLQTACESMLGFRPDDSMVVLAPSDGSLPSARVDLTDRTDVAAMILTDTFAGPSRHWQENGQILVVFYTADAELASLAGRTTHLLFPGVTVLARARVDGDLVYPMNADGVEAAPLQRTRSEDPAVLTKHVAPSRAAIEAEAQDVEDAGLAEMLAVASYRTGNGARAWVFHDRAVELLGRSSDAMTTLEHALTHATPPPVA